MKKSIVRIFAVVLSALVSTPSLAEPSTDEKVQGWRMSNEVCTGVFCELSGGTYLNAIYENDAELIEKLDAAINKSIERRFAAIASLSDRLGEEQQAFSLLPVLADTYLSQYGTHYAQSCSANISEKTVTKDNAYFGMSDRKGVSNKSTGKTLSYTYTINQDMLALCDRVCDNTGGKSERYMVNNTGNIGAMNTLSGLSKLMTDNTCDSKQVQQFEQNLRALTNNYLDEYR